MNHDRISKAWQLRHDLHEFLKSNQGATVVQIFAHKPTVCTETVRKALRRLRDDGNVEMTGGAGRVSTFRAITEEIKPEIHTRNKLAFAAAKSNKDKYVDAHALRVKVLAHIETVGRISGPDLAIAIEITRDHANRVCNAMCREETLSRTGTGTKITYAPTGKPLVSADEMRARVYKLRNENRRESDAHKPVGGPGSKVYLGGRLKSTAQGGQGSVRRQVHMGSTLG